MFRGIFAAFCLFSAWVVCAAPTVTLTGNSVLDSKAIYFVSYDGVVNTNSFQVRYCATSEESTLIV